MQDDAFDDMDDLIREAAESHHPVYDDKAWDNMRVLLDTHMPQKEHNRKPFFLWMFFLLTGLVTAVTVFYTQDSNEKSGNLVNKTTQRVLPVQPVQPLAVGIAAPGVNLNSIPKKITFPAGNPIYKTTVAGIYVNNFKKNLRVSLSSAKTKVITVTGAVADEFEATGDEGKPTNEATLNPNDLPAKTGKQLPGINVITDTTLIPANTKTNNRDNTEIKKTADESILKKTTLKDKNKKGFKNNFAVGVSAGPEFSFTSLNNLGKVKLNYGAGLSYNVGKRFVVRSGFYVSRKIYSSSPADYHPPAGYWTYNANMQRVDADCYLYEIPLGASYGFKPVKNHRWLVAAGVSSLIMKTETYHYLYKNMQGQTMYKGWTLRNKNKHYFSVLTVSGGYQYQINSRISVLAEPYLKVPLQGIGFGKIKLNSGGILLTASIKPFAVKR